jgi:hypothetical protein
MIFLFLLIPKISITDAYLRMRQDAIKQQGSVGILVAQRERLHWEPDGQGGRGREGGSDVSPALIILCRSF